MHSLVHGPMSRSSRSSGSSVSMDDSGGLAQDLSTGLGLLLPTDHHTQGGLVRLDDRSVGLDPPLRCHSCSSDLQASLAHEIAS